MKLKAILSLLFIPFLVYQLKAVNYSGIVVDSISKKPLTCATVMLLNSSGKSLTTGMSDNSGAFHFKTSEPAKEIKISFVGYSTLHQDISNKNKPDNLGTFVLTPEHKTLKEVTVTQAKVTNQVDRKSYLVTEEMRRGTFSPNELLAKIQGIRYDKVQDNILVNNHTNNLILVDGIEKPQSYIATLSPERIEKIEVIKEPSGRFISEGYFAVINLILKKDYEGYVATLGGTLMVNPVGTNGNDAIANEQPRLGFSYTKTKLNLYANGVFARIRWNNPLSFQKRYEGITDLVSDPSSDKSPNEAYKYNCGVISAGADYQLSKNHSLSLITNYEGVMRNTLTDYHLTSTDLSDNQQSIINQQIKDNNDEKSYVGKLFYKGKINDRFSLYSDFMYDRYQNDVNYSFLQNENYKSNNNSNQTITVPLKYKNAL